MEILDIPELHQDPRSESGDGNPVAAADYLMTKLLCRQPAMLHAEFRVGDGRWFVRDSTGGDICIAESKSVGEFRTVLARFGHHFMGSQLYGGHTRRTVSQNRRNFQCEIFMSNQGRTGYWIRVYANAF